MSKLRCNEKDCRHNCYSSCKKQCIVLDDDAVCCSFSKKSIHELNTEMSKDMSPNYSDVETAINCNDETCYFNHDCFFLACDVKIDSDAWCETYRKK